MSATNKIKKFFAKKKAEAKFKLAGPGRKLNSDEPTTSRKSSKDTYVPPKRSELSTEAKTAAEAALARIQTKDTKEFNTSLAAIQAQVRRELEAERKAKEEQVKSSEEKLVHTEEEQKNLIVQGVFFRCPLVSEEILPRKDWKLKIKEFLYDQLADEKGLTACLIIYNCNTKEKADQCVETLLKYLENVVNNPNEEKYKKIRMSNRIFCDKVRNVEGALDFLHAAGFAEISIDDEPFLIWSEDNLESVDQMLILKEALESSEPIPLELDRNIQVLLPSQINRSSLPIDFYRISPEEIKREQQLRCEAMENAQILKTKAMREKEELRIVNRYKFAIIRIRFANGVYLQGTFNVYEKLGQVYEFVQSCLQHEAAEFSLISPTGYKFVVEDMEKSLYDLRLVPNTVFNFGYENNSRECTEYLKDELMMLIRSF